MEIRKVTLDNLTLPQFAQLCDLEENCGLEPYSPQMIMECIVSMDTFACMQGGRILGFITGIPDGTYLGRSVYIVNINVGAPYRRRGIGKRLLLHLCRFYLSDYAHLPVTLDVARNNPARNLYECFGFQKTEIPSRNGPTDIVMKTTLLDLVQRLEK